MSNTRYSRNHQLRLDDEELRVLARAAMRSIMQLSIELQQHLDAKSPEVPAVEAELRRLRSLLERLRR